MTIISSRSEEIRKMVITGIGRGVNVYKGKRCYGRDDDTSEAGISYAFTTCLGLNKLAGEIEKIDANAFVVMNSVKDTKGGMIKKRPLKH